MGDIYIVFVREEMLRGTYESDWGASPGDEVDE